MVAATEFHRRAAAAVAEVAMIARDNGLPIAPYWTVAEREGLDDPAWTALPRHWQGDGDLAMRLARVYADFLSHHDAVLMIGADAPQIDTNLLSDALEILASPSADGRPVFALGPALDGGFYLFGGDFPIATASWQSIIYSRSDTAAMLSASLASVGRIRRLSPLRDVDQADDLPALLTALRALPAALPAQTALADWLAMLLSVG